MFAGQQVPAGCYLSTILPEMDFETYSEAGYVRVPDKRKANGYKWVSATGNANTAGLRGVGAAKYSEHPSTEILWLAYDLKDGRGAIIWEQGQPYDVLQPLFDHIQRGGLIAAWNSAFEFWIWLNVAHKRMGWPYLPRRQLRDDAAKAYAHALPGKLELAAKVANPDILKDAKGTEYIKMFSIPRTATKKDPIERFTKAERPMEWYGFGSYCLTDIKTEGGISQRVPDLIPQELEVWLVDQDINERGVAIDMQSVKNCTRLIMQATVKYNEELKQRTAGAVTSATQNDKIKTWLETQGVCMENMQAETIEEVLEDNAHTIHTRPNAKRVLEIRALLGSASVKKLYAIARMVTENGRLHDIHQYHGPHTGRWAGRGVQGQNLPVDGPKLNKCESCGHHYSLKGQECPWCGCMSGLSKVVKWNPGAVDDALAIINANNGELAAVEAYLGDAGPLVVGCIRGLFVAGPGKELLCSDYSAIEAVVLACLAGEQWRIEVFQTHGMIYEESASRITGIPLEEFIRHKEETGQDHPFRKKIGKVAELGSGYQGWIGAWKNFGAAEFFNDDEEIKEKVLAWRNASPMIVAFWKGLEEAAKQAIRYPGQAFAYREISYQMKDGNLYCRLPSGRLLTYHKAFLIDTVRYGKKGEKICFWGVDSKTKQWSMHDTYGGKLTENVVQAVARDILAHALIKLEAAGYKVVMHIHDEVVIEVDIGTGSIEEVEAIMGDLPSWCSWWPISANGGWRGHRFRK